jgi:hypothetical protein
MASVLSSLSGLQTLVEIYGTPHAPRVFAVLISDEIAVVRRGFAQ